MSELRHFHGSVWHAHDGGDVPHDHGSQHRTGLTAVSVILIVLAVLGIVRVAGNEMHRNSPPVSCQLLGGHWSLWGGWSCG